MNDSAILRFSIPGIPDPGERSLAASCLGDVRGRAFQGCEQMLRVLAQSPPTMYTLAIRLHYTPGEDRQSRLGVELAFRRGPGVSPETVRRLVLAGPLSGAFHMQEVDDGGPWRPPNDWARVCTEVMRREEVWAADERKRDSSSDMYNKKVPQYYYYLNSFEPTEDNDWLSIDRLLDKFYGPALLEVVVQPTDISQERSFHHRYISQLMSINDYSLNQVAASRDPIADEILRNQEEVHRKLLEANLLFSIRCYAGTAEESLLLASTVAEAAFQKGHYQLATTRDTSPEWSPLVDSSQDLNIGHFTRNPDVWDKLGGRGFFDKLIRMPHLGTPEELKGVFRLPVGNSANAALTIRRLRTDPKPLGQRGKTILIGDDMEIGYIPPRRYSDDLEPVFTGSGGSYPEMRIKTDLIKKHIFIAGVPGSGKTTAVFNLLAQLAHLQEPIPFLVIEPAKTEYRTFKKLACHPDPVIAGLALGLRVYSVGNEQISPFRFNPLAYPKGISLDEHIGSVLACFEAAMPMGGPLQGLLAEAVEDVYGHPPKGLRFPRLKDLLRSARRIVDDKGYEGEVLGNLKAALDVRLGLLIRRSLGKVFDCEIGEAPESLFEQNTIIEMDYLTPDHACLMALFMLSSLREHIKVTRVSGSPLRHVTVLEEAHNIVGKSGQAKGSEEGTDPKAFAAQYVTRMLAELRALGEGIVVADQLPSAVAPEVIKNTGTKLVHRLVANDDREEIGGTMLLDGTAQEELARLDPGEAYLYTEGLYRPRRIRSLGSHEYLSLGQPAETAGAALPEPPDGPTLVGIISEQEWYQGSRCNRIASDLAGLELESSYVADQLSHCLDMVRKAEAIQLEMVGESCIPLGLMEKADLLRGLADDLDRTVDQLERSAWDKLRFEKILGMRGENLQKARELRDRIHESLIPDARCCTRTIRETNTISAELSKYLEASNG